MNFEKHSTFILRILKPHIVISFVCLLALSFAMTGCSDQVKLPSEKHLSEFNSAGISHPLIDSNQTMNLQYGSSYYRVSPGEVLELTIPTILQTLSDEQTADKEDSSTYMCRISNSGTIILPVVGEIEIEGKTIMEVESEIVNAYYPEYTASRPAIFARVTERHELPPFSVIGLVNQPGSFPYPYNVRYSLMQGIGLAGGLNLGLNPRYATVYRLKEDGNVITATFRIADDPYLEKALTTCIKPGDIVAVDHTPRTRKNEFIREIFRINIGTYIALDDIWED